MLVDGDEGLKSQANRFSLLHGFYEITTKAGY